MLFELADRTKNVRMKNKKEFVETPHSQSEKYTGDYTFVKTLVTRCVTQQKFCYDVPMRGLKTKGFSGNISLLSLMLKESINARCSVNNIV